MILGGGYAVTVNAGSYALFGYDKMQAQAKKWRVPEKTLQFSALLGGWIGGIAAMKQFRHKTVKTEFQRPYYLAVALNVLCIAGGAVAYKFSAPFRLKVKSIMKTRRF
ncbi:hypothetical protein HK099_007000 [Clydaea vesicula]|uniref:DUF1294 domain-containing protein n=1 Tax=Clydaea vesicula TaxID=447962 RepID=A0AAD5TXF9_9FUNG|nr:hypothetical protein HK099_007000 [Clydaea vesicula]KAJ3385191.1 hypothetical protein HDU92_003167 [Lobulomyces angularis]